MTSSVTAGSAVSGARVQTLAAVQFGSVAGILKAIVSGPLVALESRMACRSEPTPESLVFVTVNVAVCAD